ncbi:MAG: hypothetical protein IJ279_03485, partial [Clostridia bacterium]|nr:hypothetical protein [Clostridia bacterium]
EKEEYVEYSDADICFVNEEEAEVIKESVRGHANGTIEVGNTIYVSLEVYDDGAETGKSFIYTAEDSESVESDISGKYSDVREEDGKVIGKDENGNEIEVELTDKNVDETDDNADKDEEKLTRTNYYNSDGKLLYYECYAYYANGLLCSSTLYSVEHINDGTHVSDEYTILYTYDEQRNLKDKVLDSDMLNENTGEITFYQPSVSKDGKSAEIHIYPEKETIEQEKYGVDASKTEKIYDDKVTFFPDAASNGWANIYLRECFEKNEITDTSITACRFLYVDNNPIPELWIDYGFGYAGAEIYTQNSNETDVIHINHGLARWKEKQNLIFTSGGHMGVYQDNIYKIVDGKFVNLGVGDTREKYDEEFLGYEYFWNDVEVSENEYKKSIENIFGKEDAPDVKTYKDCHNVYTYDQCKLLLETISKMN